MARAGPSRSQRAPQATQQSQSRRASRRGQPEDDEENEEEVQAEEEDDEDEDVDMDAASQGDELTRRANDLVRLALFTEHKRTPLRRDEISKKGMSLQTTRKGTL